MEDAQLPPVEPYEEYKARMAAELAGQTKEDVLATTDGVDIDNLPKQQHNWVRRGIKMSCEGARHPHHSHFLVRR